MIWLQCHKRPADGAQWQEHFRKKLQEKTDQRGIILSLKVSFNSFHSRGSLV